MNYNDFCSLRLEQQLELVNKRLEEMRVEKIPDKDFKTDILEFSLKTMEKHFEEREYMRMDNRFIPRLNAYDIITLKNIVKSSEWVYASYSLGANIHTERTDKIQTTTIRVYEESWKKWNEFCKNKTVSKEELLTTALEEFMKRY